MARMQSLRPSMQSAQCIFAYTVGAGLGAELKFTVAMVAMVFTLALFAADDAVEIKAEKAA
eukprot:COSAG04_NODE_8358_length_985_cov_1.174746_2_plen_61_part_00